MKVGAGMSGADLLPTNSQEVPDRAALRLVRDDKKGKVMVLSRFHMSASQRKRVMP